MASFIPIMNQNEFQYIIRVLNTNIDGYRKIPYALTAIKGVGIRFAILACRKTGIDISKRAGELSVQQIDKIVDVLQNPLQYNVPVWFLNRQKDNRDGTYTQLLSNNVDTKLREDIQHLQRIRAHRGIRHYWGLRVRGQHTKTSGRSGRTVGVSHKKSK